MLMYLSTKNIAKTTKLYKFYKAYLQITKITKFILNFLQKYSFLNQAKKLS